MSASVTLASPRSMTSSLDKIYRLAGYLLLLLLAVVVVCGCTSLRECARNSSAQMNIHGVPIPIPIP
jgi:hypothetical protein